MHANSIIYQVLNSHYKKKKCLLQTEKNVVIILKLLQ